MPTHWNVLILISQKQGKPHRSSRWALSSRKHKSTWQTATTPCAQEWGSFFCTGSVAQICAFCLSGPQHTVSCRLNPGHVTATSSVPHHLYQLSRSIHGLSPDQSDDPSPKRCPMSIPYHPGVKMQLARQPACPTPLPQGVDMQCTQAAGCTSSCLVLGLLGGGGRPSAVGSTVIGGVVHAGHSTARGVLLACECKRMEVVAQLSRP